MTKVGFLLPLLLLGLLPACSLAREPGIPPTPALGTMAPEIILPPSPSAAAIPSTEAMTAPTKPPESTPAATRTRLPTPTFEGTPPTPTQLPQPYHVNVVDWELVKATSPALCPDCGDGTIIIPAPRNLHIAVVQVYMDGASGAASSLTTDLNYPSPEILDCSFSEESSFCGLLFGQVYAGRITLTARFTRGAQHRLDYLITFQDWADYQP